MLVFAYMYTHRMLLTAGLPLAAVGIGEIVV